MDKYINELLYLIVVTAISLLSIFINKLRLNGKNNKMLKIVDMLMVISEYAGLEGADKKKLVLKMFEDFKVGKIDNIADYIDDKISLANKINVKKSDINAIIHDNLLKNNVTPEDIEYNLATENEDLRTQIMELHEQLITKDTQLKLREQQLAKLRRGE